MKHKITRPKAKKITSGEIVDLIVILFLAAVTVLYIFLSIVKGSNQLFGNIPKVLFILIVTALFAFNLYIKRQKRKELDQYQSEIMDSISDQELEELNSQLTKDNYYKTFYLTEKYICFPREASKLVPYDQIENVYAEYRSYGRYTRGMFMFLTLKNGMTIRALIEEPVKFNKKKDAFLIEFKEILKNGSKIN